MQIVTITEPDEADKAHLWNVAVSGPHTDTPQLTWVKYLKNICKYNRIIAYDLLLKAPAL